MKLPIAIAVLFLVLAANTEAEEAQAEPTLEEHFTNFGVQMAALADQIKDKTKTTFDKMQQSEAAVTAREWFDNQFQKIKETMDETFNTQ
ncbi:hypothetical protein AAFF_G00126250 [Aldrovandia affinis]|uniref:Apolipoprotein C-I n=1 Tax=Aldrovandia affinis TaxID=143900 RepID=A0AAD7RR60_9TELE|nr:hypothetical protein AAFF_G00126250 [Aldrovandia affinis]